MPYQFCVQIFIEFHLEISLKLGKNHTASRIFPLYQQGVTCVSTLKIELEARWAEPVSLAFHSALRKLNAELSIGASHQVSAHLAKQFQRRFLEIDQTETRIACGAMFVNGSGHVEQSL